MSTELAVVAIALVGFTVAQSARPQEFQIASTTVTVTSAQSVTSNQRDTLYQVRLRYRSVGGDSRADLIGVGPLAGEGAVTLLIDKPKLAFRTAAGATPTEVQVTVTGIAAGDGVEFPELADFRATNTYDCNCSDEGALVGRVLETLSRFFFEGVRPQTLTPPQRVLTMFHRLDGVPQGVLGKVAVMIEYPVTLPDKKVGFRLGWVAIESRIQSRDTWIPAANDRVIAAATDYVKGVVGYLRGMP